MFTESTKQWQWAAYREERGNERKEDWGTVEDEGWGGEVDLIIYHAGDFNVTNVTPCPAVVLTDNNTLTSRSN